MFRRKPLAYKLGVTSDYFKQRARLANARFAAKYTPPLVRAAPARTKAGAFVRQLKALVAGKKKDAADVTRATAGFSATTISCLTSSTDYATAASGTGLLDMDGDEALINSITIRQRLTVTTLADADPTANGPIQSRTILVWFYKPLLVPSAAGTLPPITEVLVTDEVGSLPVPDTQNSGRFTIIYDKTDLMGINTIASATGTAITSGPLSKYRTLKVKVDKRCHFKVAGVSGTPSGHYDDNINPGQVDKGLFVMYQMFSANGTAGTLNVDNRCRLNYTG